MQSLRTWLSPAMEALLQDLRFASHLLVRDGRFSATVAAVLGLGIGVSHLFFTLTYAHTVRGLPMPGIDRVLHVSTVDLQGADRGVSYPDFVDLRQGQQAFEDLAAFASQPMALGDQGRAPERVDGTYATAAAFSMAKVTPLIGRVLDLSDDRPGSPAVAVLAERLWRSRYGGDPAVIGHAVQVNEAPFVVIGVVSDASGFPSAAALWVPLAHMPGVLKAARDARTLRVFGRVRDGVAIEEGRAEIESLDARLAESFPDARRGIRLRVVPLNERFVTPRAGWWPFMIAGVIVIAVSAINVGNLMMVRSARRVRELAIRSSLGASRGRIVRQLLLEATTVSSVGAALGLVLSRVGVWIHDRNIPEPFQPYWARYDMDATVWLGLVAMLGGIVVASALTPALLAARVDATMALKEGGRTDTGRHLGRAFTTAMLGLQLALALVLLTQVGLTTFEASLNEVPTDRQLSDPGVLTGSFALSAPRYATADARRAFHRRAMDRIGAVPGVSGVALASHLPLSGAVEHRLRLARNPVAPHGTWPAVWAVEITPGYFDVLGLPVRRGRGLSDADSRPGSYGVLVNERFARLHFQGAEPIGEAVALDPKPETDSEWRTIVGVVPDVRQHTTLDVRPLVYLPLGGSAPQSATILLRADRSTASSVRDAFRELDPSLPLHQVQTLGASRDYVQWIGRTSSRLALTVTLAATLLAVAGLYAVVSYRVVLRTREIGMRMVLGALPRQIAWIVVTSVRHALLLGLSVGLIGVLAWTRTFAPDGVGGAARAGRLALFTAISLAVMAVVASALPARRAASLLPGESLRRDT